VDGALLFIICHSIFWHVLAFMAFASGVVAWGSSALYLWEL